jgi:hypothetical protein
LLFWVYTIEGSTVTYEQFKEWYDELPILAYGELSDEEIFDAFRTILQWKADDKFISTDIPDNLYTVHEYWLFLGLLCDCIEYGSSPRGGWLTDFGGEVLLFLQNTSNAEISSYYN